EVVADELVGAVASVQTARSELVQLGPHDLRDAAVRHVADEDVVEAEAILPRIDQSPFRQSSEVAAVVGVGFEVVELCRRKGTPDDRGSSEYAELPWIEPIESARQQR